jgi:PAS domain S-box-containing protein
MTGAPLPVDEAARAAALADLGILDSGLDEEFDALVAVASTVCGMPISLISLVDEKRQWFKANIGLPGVMETPRELAFCGYTILGEALLEVPDATADSRFAGNPLVTGAPGIRFYAGMPLRLGSGYCAGSLCVIGTRPARLDDMQREVLRKLGRAAAVALDRWAARQRLEDTAKVLAGERRRLENLVEGTGLATWELNIQTGEFRTNGRWQQMVGRPVRDISQLRALYHPDDLVRAGAAMHRYISGESERYEAESRVLHADGRWVWLQSQGGAMVRTADGAPEWVFGWSKDITDQKQQGEALRRSERLMAETGRVAGVGGWEIDLLTGAMSWTPQAFVIAGVAPDRQPTMEEALAFYTPEVRQQVTDARARVVADGGTYDLEVPFIRADGTRIWVRSVGSAVFEDGRAVRLVGAFLDVTDQVNQRKALRRSERLMAETGRVAGVGGWEIDLVTGAMSWTPQAFVIAGVAPDRQPTAEEALAFYAPEVRQQVIDERARVVADGSAYDLEVPFTRADGTCIWVRSVGSAVFEDGRAVRLVGAFMDVTGHVNRRALDLANERMQLAVDSGRIGLWDWNIETDTMVWDEWLCRLYGRAGATHSTSFAGWLGTVHAADAPRVNQHIQQAIAGERPFNPEFRVLWPDGSVHTLLASATIVRDGSGQAVRAVGTNVDVTEARNLAAALAEHSELLQVTLNSIGDAIITADAAARVVWLNPVAERLTRWAAQEAAGRTMPEVFDIIDEDTRATRQDLVAACLARGEAVEMPGRTMLISRLGEEYGITVSVAPIRGSGRKAGGESDQVRGVVIVFRDETRERRLEAEREARLRELRAANAELDRLARHLARARSIAEQANRAKTRFLAGMSHELRTPLNGILGYAQLLHIDGSLTATQSERVHAMMTAGTHLLEMIHCVLDLSDIETGGDAVNLAETDLRQLSEASLEMVRPAASAKCLALGVTIEPSVPRLVMADAKRIRQVLLNLLGNAVKYTMSGTVALRVREAQDGTRLRFEVTDTGPGIAPGKRHRLFVEFDRLDNDTAANEGAGLGLSLASKFAGLMGGRIGYEDNAGGGSLFWLEVPLVPVAAPPVEAEAVRAPSGQEVPAAAAALPILVVDDVAMNRDIAAAFLQSAGYEAICAEGGREGVQAAADRDWLAILMDVRMPEMDGLEATRRIRALPPPRDLVPIIALTAQAFTDEIEKCRAAGMDSHVAKPFTFEALLEAVRRGVHIGIARRNSPDIIEPGAELPILDAEALGRTAAVLPAASVTAYLSTLIEKGEALQGALRQRDTSVPHVAALADAAHAMAGSAGMFGFDRLVFVARGFERAVKADPAQAATLANGLDITLSASLKAMRSRNETIKQKQPA